MLAIVRKELADVFNSVRFFVLFILVLLASAGGLYVVQQGIRAALEQSQAVTHGGFIFLALFTATYQGIPILTLALSIMIPITGIVLGFDAINSERTGGTMSRLLAQPVYRDGVINGKFLAGVITMALMVGTALLLIAGFGLRMIGVPPTAEEIIRLFIYFVITVVYGAFWMALAMLFSVLFRRAAGALMIPVILLIVLFFFWTFAAGAITNAIAPVDTNSPLAAQIHNLELKETILRISPSYLYQEAFSFVLNPVMIGMGVITMEQAGYILPNPLSMGQALLEVWPHIVGLLSLSVVLFAISYIVFMKQEVRAN